MRYLVSSGLSVRLWPEGQKDRSLRGDVEGVAATLKAFWATLESPPPAGQLRFSFDLHQVVVLEGMAEVVGDHPDEGGEVELEIDSISPPYDSCVTELMAPLIDPEHRHDFLQGVKSDLAGRSSLVSPWIQSANRLSRLVDLIGEINSSQETEVLLGNIMRAAQEVMEAEASSLMLLDEDTEELIIALPTGPASAEISGIRIPAGKGFGGWVVTHGTPLFVEEAADDPRFFGDVAASGFKTHDLICVPMRSPQGRILGALQAINHKGGNPFQESDVAILTTLAAQAAIALDRERLVKEAIQRQILENELRLASDIQTGFWPKQVPEFEHFRISGNSRPARHVGGDYYDFIPLNESEVALVIADISGKGVAAALMMAFLRAVLRPRLKGSHDLEQVVRDVNEILVEDTPVGKFATLFACLVDTSSRQLTYVNAGHDPPLLVSTEGQIRELRTGGPIVGFRSDLEYSCAREELQPGDLLVMFTDGVTETQNSSEEFFGRERLCREILTHRSQPPEAMIGHLHSQLDAFKGEAPQHDDITLLIASVT